MKAENKNARPGPPSSDAQTVTNAPPVTLLTIVAQLAASKRWTPPAADLEREQYLTGAWYSDLRHNRKEREHGR